jgi:hypothetical protein
LFDSITGAKFKNMTEAAFQECRKVMQKANGWRSMIATAKGNVAKWTKIEDVHRREGRESQADGANKMLQRALAKLNEYRQRFSDLKFPDDNLKETVLRCLLCGEKIKTVDDHTCQDQHTNYILDSNPKAFR